MKIKKILGLALALTALLTFTGIIKAKAQFGATITVTWDINTAGSVCMGAMGNCWYFPMMGSMHTFTNVAPGANFTISGTRLGTPFNVVISKATVDANTVDGVLIASGVAVVVRKTAEGQYRIYYEYS